MWLVHLQHLAPFRAGMLDSAHTRPANADHGFLSCVEQYGSIGPVSVQKYRFLPCRDTTCCHDTDFLRDFLCATRHVPTPFKMDLGVPWAGCGLAPPHAEPRLGSLQHGAPRLRAPGPGAAGPRTASIDRSAGGSVKTNKI